MNVIKSERLRKLAIGLAIAAFLAGVAAFLIGYLKNGEISFLPIGIAGVMIAAIMLATRTKKSMDE